MNIPQDRVQDAAVPVIIHLNRRVQTTGNSKLSLLAVLTHRLNLHILPRCQVIVHVKGKGLLTRQPQALLVVALFEL